MSKNPPRQTRFSFLSTQVMLIIAPGGKHFFSVLIG